MKVTSISATFTTVMPAFLLVGCAASFQPVLPDYNGTDVAYLRFDNSPVYTSLRQASCQMLQPVPYIVKSSGEPDKEYSVNARFSIMGIKSSYGKKVEGSAPVSSKFADKSYMEYKVKSGETYAIKWVFTDKGMYNSFDRSWVGSVTPEAGHTYEVTIGGGSDGNDVVINDITSR